MKSKSSIVDTNIIFSALIPIESKIRSCLIDSNYQFYCPNYVIYEIYAHKEKMIKHSKLSATDFYILMSRIIDFIRFIPSSLVSYENKKKAFELCFDIDENDVPFIALSLELDIPLWTGDNKLISGLKEKGFNNFFELK